MDVPRHRRFYRGSIALFVVFCLSSTSIGSGRWLGPGWSEAAQIAGYLAGVLAWTLMIEAYKSVSADR
ncbi:MAG TPA: hypothetical protein VEJ18_14665 [Planctomycetota bacterium]|nr:hypothetical protein [Planctomycetota bacterium]